MSKRTLSELNHEAQELLKLIENGIQEAEKNSNQVRMSYGKFSSVSLSDEKYFKCTLDFVQFSNHQIYDYYVYQYRKQGFGIYRAIAHSIITNQIRWVFTLRHQTTPLVQCEDVGEWIVEILAKWIHFYTFLICCTEWRIGKDLFLDKGLVHPQISSTDSEWKVEKCELPSLFAIIRNLVLFYSVVVDDEIQRISNGKPCQKLTRYHEILNSLLNVPWDKEWIPLCNQIPDENVKIKTLSFAFQKMYTLQNLCHLLPTQAKESWSDFVNQMKNSEFEFDGLTTILSAFFTSDDSHHHPLRISFMTQQPHNKLDFSGKYLKLHKQESAIDKEQIFQTCPIYFQDGQYYSLIHRQVLCGSMKKKDLLEWLYPKSIPTEQVELYSSFFYTPTSVPLVHPSNTYSPSQKKGSANEFQNLPSFTNEKFPSFENSNPSNLLTGPSVPTCQLPFVHSFLSHHHIMHQAPVQTQEQAPFQQPKQAQIQQYQSSQPQVPFQEFQQAQQAPALFQQLQQPQQAQIQETISDEILFHQIQNFAIENLHLQVFLYKTDEKANLTVTYGIKIKEDENFVWIVNYEGQQICIAKSTLNEKSFSLKSICFFTK